MLATAINGYAHLKVPHLFGREKINKLIFTPQRFLMTWAKVLPLNLIKLAQEILTMVMCAISHRVSPKKLVVLGSDKEIMKSLYLRLLG